MRRPDRDVRTLLGLALAQTQVSRAPDYWQGVEDGLRFALGETPQAIAAWLDVLLAQGQRAGTGQADDDGDGDERQVGQEGD